MSSPTERYSPSGLQEMAPVVSASRSAPASRVDLAVMSAYAAAMEPERAPSANLPSPSSAEIEKIREEARAREASTQGKQTLLDILKTGDWEQLRITARSLKDVLSRADKEAVCQKADSFAKKTAFQILCRELEFTFEEGPD